MMKTKTEIKRRASQWMDDNNDADQAHGEGFVKGYTEAQDNMMKFKKAYYMMKFKKAYYIMSAYFDSISDEEQPKVSKQLEKLGL